MSRHKSRFTRRGRHKGRVGTRKQAGGFNWPWANKNPADPNAAAPPATPNPSSAPGTEAESKSWWSLSIFNPFKSKSAATNANNKPVDPNADPNAAPGAAALATPDKPWWKVWGGGSKRKSRKTRHRRRRHHRK
jgi:hypothetical protein